MTIYRVNPTMLMDEFQANNIKTINGITTNKLNLQTGVCESCECEFVDGTDMELVNDIISKHNPYKVINKKPTQQETINANLIKEIAQQKLLYEKLKNEINTIKGV